MEISKYKIEHADSVNSLLHSKIAIVGLMLVYKLLTDWCFFRILAPVDSAYELFFNPFKFIVGIVVCIVLFVVPLCNTANVSSFFLILINLTQIVPITTIFSFSDENAEYYLLLCLAFLICETITVFSSAIVVWFSLDKKVIVGISLLIILGLLAIIVVKYGGPSLTALNIYSVYEMRESGNFSLSKYSGYIFKWAIYAIIPFLTALAIYKNKRIISIGFIAVLFLLYLYSGHKAILFSAPLILVIGVWSKRNDFLREFCLFFCFAFSILITLTLLIGKPSGIVYEIYSLLCRRTMILSANNKFLYFDYFTEHPKLGFYGMIPTFLIKLNSPYEAINYSYDISAVYYDAPNMNSNTGFLAEGFMRFGIIGILLSMLLFAFILKQFDGFQRKTSFSFAATAFVVPVFLLNDAHLLDELVFGFWMIIELILIFYPSNKYDKELNPDY